jgi:hypothetical protein
MQEILEIGNPNIPTPIKTDTPIINSVTNGDGNTTWVVLLLIGAIMYYKILQDETDEEEKE